MMEINIIIALMIFALGFITGRFTVRSKK